MRFLSPLRYPGGKGRLASFITEITRAQSPRPTVYVEPFAGGAGVALRLLVTDEVRFIQINDLDPGIAALWRCVFFETEALARLIETATIDIDTWHSCSRQYRDPSCSSDLQLGFATLFLNRCNRSGILKARPIGGLSQDGRWRMDVRFNRKNLADRVRLLGQFRRRVVVTQSDGREVLRSLSSKWQEVIAYVDPPYLLQGEGLYMDSLRPADHDELASILCGSDLRWFLTYDVHERVIKDLYRDMRCIQFDIAHTAQSPHVGSEYGVFSANLNIPNLTTIPRGNSRWIVC